MGNTLSIVSPRALDTRDAAGAGAGAGSGPGATPSCITTTRLESSSAAGAASILGFFAPGVRSPLYGRQQY